MCLRPPRSAWPTHTTPTSAEAGLHRDVGIRGQIAKYDTNLVLIKINSDNSAAPDRLPPLRRDPALRTTITGRPH
jgi:hypothetical protein